MAQTNGKRKRERLVPCDQEQSTRQISGRRLARGLTRFLICYKFVSDHAAAKKVLRKEFDFSKFERLAPFAAVAQAEKQGAVDEFMNLDHRVALDADEAQGMQDRLAASPAMAQLHLIASASLFAVDQQFMEAEGLLLELDRKSREIGQNRLPAAAKAGIRPMRPVAVQGPLGLGREQGREPCGIAPPVKQGLDDLLEP
jgi:hypothetical protein